MIIFWIILAVILIVIGIFVTHYLGEIGDFLITVIKDINYKGVLVIVAIVVLGIIVASMIPKC